MKGSNSLVVSITEDLVRALESKAISSNRNNTGAIKEVFLK